MKKVFLSALGVFLIAGLIFVGCAQPAQAPSSPPKTLDIGVASALTGPMAFVGTLIKNAALLAIDDQNKEGGVTIAGQKYLLNAIVRDTKQDLVLGKNIAEELIFDKGVKVIIGPYISDAIGAQRATEPNKVIAIFAGVIVPGMCGPDKPYSFFWNAPFEQYYVSPAAYVQKFYPEAKTVVSFSPDIPSIPSFVVAIESVLPQYGLTWLGIEKFPLGTKDLTPVISRVLAKNPDIVDLCCTGGVAGLGSVSIKQIRQAGFDGPIMASLPPARGEMEEVLPKEYLTKIVIAHPDVDSPIVSEAFRAVYNKAKEKYQEKPETALFNAYNPVRAFFKFLDGQDSMDTTAWMESFARYHWQGIFGYENYWMGKKVWGIDRRVFGCPWVSEYRDGKLVTEFTAPIPYDMFAEK